MHRGDMDKLWIDPHDYQDQLESAVEILSTRMMNVSIYNHQLCVLRQSEEGGLEGRAGRNGNAQSLTERHQDRPAGARTRNVAGRSALTRLLD